jgi:anaerobic ribonucleoside-triphosphate reductase activating protein
MHIRVHEITETSYVDGPGLRAVVFFQGCSIRCPGCQNRHLWPTDGGQEMEVSEVARQLVATGLPITISGGEPFDQAAGLARLLWEIRLADSSRHVIVYTGYTFEDLMRSEDSAKIEAVALADILVDGPYQQEHDSPGMQYRGSTNQRAIDVCATATLPLSFVFSFGPVTHDWDTPELIITREGNVLAPTPLAMQFSELGKMNVARRCGQVA